MAAEHFIQLLADINASCPDLPSRGNPPEFEDQALIVFASSEDKVGLAVGVTEKLVQKYDAVKFAKLGSEIIGGKGGGGRKDFAQAGGQFIDKIQDAFEKIKTLI